MTSNATLPVRAADTNTQEPPVQPQARVATAWKIWQEMSAFERDDLLTLMRQDLHYLSLDLVSRR